MLSFISMMLTDHVFLTSAWIIYCVLHSALATVSFKERMRKAMGTAFKYYRPVYVLFSFVGLAGLIWWTVNLPSPRVFDSKRIVEVTGMAIALLGLLLMAVCIRKYFLGLSGIRSLLQDSYSNELIITGVHGYVRHPLYLGTFIFIWGLWLILPSVSFLFVNSVITIYTLIGMRLEEKKLLSEFGEAYRQYQKNVPMLLPRRRNKGVHREFR